MMRLPFMRRTAKALAVGTMIGALAHPAAAHPHAAVEQHAALSLGRTETVVAYRIVPSAPHGAAMHAHLDRNGDGTVDEGERAAFAADLVEATTLTADGGEISLAVTDVTIPERDAMTVGLGTIEVRARASLALDRDAPHAVTVEIRYVGFADAWFVQPHYFPDLLDAGTPTVSRDGASSAVIIAVPSGR